MFGLSHQACVSHILLVYISWFIGPSLNIWGHYINPKTMHYFKTEFPSNLPYLSFHDPPHHLKKNYEDPSQTGVMMKTMHYFHLFFVEIP